MMVDRTQRCAAGGGKSNYTACFPLLWSLNPNLLRIAPDWIRWYYNKSYETGADYFVLPPSGTTYPSNAECFPLVAPLLPLLRRRYLFLPISAEQRRPG